MTYKISRQADYKRIAMKREAQTSACLKSQRDSSSFRRFLAGNRVSFCKAFWPNEKIDPKASQPENLAPPEKPSKN